MVVPRDGADGRREQKLITTAGENQYGRRALSRAGAKCARAVVVVVVVYLTYIHDMAAVGL